MSSLEFSCKNSSNHGDKWILKNCLGNTDVNFCFACCILFLEEKQLMVHKEAKLSILLDVLQRNPSAIVNMALQDDQVSLHTAIVFLDLCYDTSDRIMTTSSECLLLFLIHAEKEDLRLAVAQKLTVEIEDEISCRQKMPRIHLLGRLFQAFPELSHFVLSLRPQVFKLLASIMTDPSDEVRSAVSFIFLQLYSVDFKGNEEVFMVLDSLVTKGILNILKNGLAKDAMKHALALLKVFIQRDSKRIGLLFENISGEINFVTVIKKTIVSSEPAFQVAIVQCLCQILSFPSSSNHHVEILIDGNVPELLFEVASIKNELLVETVLCCLMLLSKFPVFYEKCQVMYGLTTILDVTSHLLEIRNMRLFIVALNLLTSLISSVQYILAASLLNSFLIQALDMVECSFKMQSPQVLSATCRFFSLLLKKASSCLPVDLSKLDSILQLCLKTIQKFFLAQQSTSSSHVKKCYDRSNDESILISGLNIIYYFIKVTKPCSGSLVSEEIFACPIVERDESSLKLSNQQNLNHIFKICILALEKTFLPHCLLISELEFKKVAWIHLTSVLHIVYEEPFEDEILSTFSRRLIKMKLFNFVWDLKVSDAQIDSWYDSFN